MAAASPGQMPEDLRDLLENDPQVAALADASVGHPYREVLKARTAPDTSQTRFAKLSLFHEDPLAERKWLNKPAGLRSSDIGRGQGLAKVVDKPQIEEDGRRPAQRADIFREGSWLVVSKTFDDIVRRLDAAAIESIPVDWRFNDGQLHDGVRFLDVTRQLDAFDYRHSEVRLYIEHDRKSIDGLNYPRALKAGIAPGVHLLRDSWLRSEILISLELARALVDAGMRGFRADDLQTGRPIPLGYRH